MKKAKSRFDKISAPDHDDNIHVEVGRGRAARVHRSNLPPETPVPDTSDNEYLTPGTFAEISDGNNSNHLAGCSQCRAYQKAVIDYLPYQQDRLVLAAELEKICLGERSLGEDSE
jgi:hypothetical protein